MNRAPRKCVACRATFRPSSPEEWWCSDECHGELEVLASLNREADRDVARDREGLEVESEAEVARKALRSPSPAWSSSAFSDCLDVVSTLATLATRLSSPDDGMLILQVAAGYLERAMATLSPSVSDAVRDDLQLADDLPEGADRLAEGEE